VLIPFSRSPGALEEYRRRLFLEEANQAFAELRKDPTAWQEELEERRIWDRTLADGLEEEPVSTYAGL
jgi:hypothetical protein